ncbi:MAG TPA: hypothetical protein DCY15_02445 [Ruminococcaceae bacterium]|nr:hypothetical protein [Oscillospiraceae bacterium]
MKLFFKYIRYNLRFIILFLIFIAVFAVVFVLYGLPIQAVAYPAALCVPIGILFVAVDFRSVKKKHDKLCEIQNLTSSMIDTLPEIKSIEETDYQELIKKLTQEISESEYKSSIKYQDMVDYYTVWVHQIKTPIASMRLSLQTEDSPLSRRLSSELFRIEQYVEMVLAFLRLDSTSTDYVFKEHDLDNIVRKSIKRFSTEFIERKIRLEYEPMSQTVITDEKWFSFVIEQLLSNALKYTREGSIKIYAKDEKLFIEDTGIGIAPEDLPRIFEKGYTGCNGRLDSKSSGLGLYLCKRVCDNLEIDITADSKIDAGTKITLDLEQYKIKTE